jgi:hypothetical protein
MFTLLAVLRFGFITSLMNRVDLISQDYYRTSNTKFKPKPKVIRLSKTHFELFWLRLPWNLLICKSNS